MKLTIEQAKQYIGCQVQYNGEKLFLNGVSCPDNSHNINYDAVLLIDEQGFCDHGINGWVNIEDIKLILHKLSDLTKEIEINEETTSCYLELLEIYPEIDEYGSIINGFCDTNQYYELLQKLFERHFWIFDQSYFDEGIIIDINTLKT